MSGPTDDAAARARLNRRLWVVFALVLAAQLWPLREVGNRIEPFLGPLPLTVVWHLAGVSALVVVYLLWMVRVWIPGSEELHEVDAPEERG
jgi:hypothetical protein